MISLKRVGNKKITILTICYDFLGHENQISAGWEGFYKPEVLRTHVDTMSLWGQKD